MLRATLVLVTFGLLIGGPGSAKLEVPTPPPLAPEVLATPVPQAEAFLPPIIFGSLAPGQLPILIPPPSLRLCDPDEFAQYCPSNCVDCVVTATSVFCFGC